jgi:hypothetical protein
MSASTCANAAETLEPATTTRVATQDEIKNLALLNMVAAASENVFAKSESEA